MRGYYTCLEVQKNIFYFNFYYKMAAHQCAEERSIFSRRSAASSRSVQRTHPHPPPGHSAIFLVFSASFLLPRLHSHPLFLSLVLFLAFLAISFSLCWLPVSPTYSTPYALLERSTCYRRTLLQSTHYPRSIDFYRSSVICCAPAF